MRLVTAYLGPWLCVEGTSAEWRTSVDTTKQTNIDVVMDDVTDE